MTDTLANRGWGVICASCKRKLSGDPHEPGPVYCHACKYGYKPLPLVTIGLPVFNGAATIALALDSLLAQDYPRLEIIVSDNDSTDDTRDICMRYARNDSRILVQWSVENRGAAANFNCVAVNARGEYFLWAAHDDLWEPSFISACVEQLQRCPGAVLCQAHTDVSVQGQSVYLATLDSFEPALSLAGRYREALARVPATAVYGVMRTAALKRTHWFGNEMALLAELSLYGRFVQVPRVLFHYHASAKWKPERRVGFGVLFLNHAKRLIAAPLSRAMKLRLFAVLLAHEAKRLTLRLAILLAPECIGLAVYRRWFRQPNLRVVDAEVFQSRVCAPQMRGTR